MSRMAALTAEKRLRAWFEHLNSRSGSAY